MVIFSLKVTDFVFVRFRMKRTSDQHLADLEARMGLKNVKGVAVTVPLGSGVIDIEKM